MLRTGGLEDGRVVRFIDLAFLAKPTHKALLEEAISGAVSYTHLRAHET